MMIVRDDFLTLDDGARLRIADSQGSGPTIVLVHGWKQSHRLFDQVIHRLGKDHRVIAYDQRGMGESSKCLAELPDLTFDQLASDLDQVLEQLDARSATVVGWSMGCTTALSLLRTPHPRIDRLMLVNGPIRLTKADGFPWALDEAELAPYVEGMEDSWPADQRAFLQDSLLPQNAAIAPLLEFVAWQTPLPCALALVRAQARVDHRSTIKNLRIPVLAAYSSRDPYWPWELAEWIAAEAPQGRSFQFTNSGHCAPLEEPAEFCRVLRAFACEKGSEHG